MYLWCTLRLHEGQGALLPCEHQALLELLLSKLRTRPTFQLSGAPGFVVKTLEQTPKVGGRYFFWNGVDRLEATSVLLGHQSVRITEKHYAPWVRALFAASSTPNP